jgi:hypothetical protein
MPHTKSAYEVAQYLKGFVEGLQTTLGIESVFYGDQRVIPKSPTVCVEPAIRDKRFNNSGQSTNNEMAVHIIVYMSGGVQPDGVLAIQQQCDELTDALSDLIDRDGLSPNMGANSTQFGGLVIDGIVVRTEYSYALKGNSGLMRANRLTVECRSKTSV